MITPTPKQLAVRDHEADALLILAPAGCGKTEALALRVAGIVEKDAYPANRRVLVLSFTNRARDNIQDRLGVHLRLSSIKRRVTVANFHGLAARVIRAHANVLNLPAAVEMPDTDWVTTRCRSRKLSWEAARQVQEILRELKQTALSDDDILNKLAAIGNSHALEIERERQSEGILTYDDLPRLAEIALANSGVSSLYANHFSHIIVDEFQDLTMQQLRMVRAIGFRRTTYAGDLAQGIYSFAGASPEAVLAAIEKEVSDTVAFDESHRSSPAVLALVNSLAPITGGSSLTCAEPDSWPGGGLAGRTDFGDVAAEAEWIELFALGVLERAPSHRVAVIARTKSRTRFLEARLTDNAITHYRWDDPILDTATANTVKRCVSHADLNMIRQSADPVATLLSFVDPADVLDPKTAEMVSESLSWAADLVLAGDGVPEILERIVVGDDSALLSKPGVHVLNAHVGKGQQFDWVIVCGTEDGIIPDFRAVNDAQNREEARVLSVMISRARHGVILTHSSDVPTANGQSKTRVPSRFFDHMNGNYYGNSEIRSWLKSADWEALSTR